MKLTKWISLLSVCGILLVGIIGSFDVFGDWIYSQAMSEAIALDIKVQVVPWDGYDQLPDDDGSGYAHAALIERMINGEGIGLNSSNSYLNEQIEYRKSRFGRDTLGSMAITQGAELEELFDLQTENVTFLIQMVSNTKYYIFTTSLDLGEKKKPNYAIDSTIPSIYRTTVEKQNGVWVATKTEEGSATSAFYEESQYILITRSKIPSFDPDSFVVKNAG